MKHIDVQIMFTKYKYDHKYYIFIETDILLNILVVIQSFVKSLFYR